MQAMSSRVGWGDDNDGAGTVVGADGCEIDAPDAIAEMYPVGNDAHARDVGENGDERIGRLGREDAVTRLAEQAEPPGIGLACGGREADAGGVHARPMTSIIGRDGSARSGRTERIGLVPLAAGRPEKRRDLGARPAKAGDVRVAHGEIHERRARGAASRDGKGERVGRGVEHEEEKRD